MGRVDVFARLDLGSSGSLSTGPCVEAYLEEAFHLGTCVETGVFRAVCFFLGLGLAGGTKLSPVR